MITLTTVLFISLTSLVCGIVIGALVTRLNRPTGQQRELESELQKAQEELATYRHDITNHFAETAQRINTLNQSYRDVHDHLASSALKFANVEISRQMLGKTSSSESLIKETLPTDESIEPPRDWAPKTPGETGMLSESYGIDSSFAHDVKTPAKKSSTQAASNLD